MACARELAERYPERITSCKVTKFYPTQWTNHLKKLQQEKKGAFFKHKDYMIVYLNDSEYIGNCDNFLEWALQQFRYVDTSNQIIYKKLALNAHKEMINTTKGRSYVYFDIKVGISKDDKEPAPVHKAIIELFDDQCPKTCANFKKLCCGFTPHGAPADKSLSFCDTTFNRVVPGSFIQGGNLRKEKSK